MSDLARLIYENKAELALDDGFASKIEPADTDKDAFIVAHPGAAEYINDDTKSFMDRYSDMMYLGRGRALHHRLDLCRHLHQGDPGRAGESQRARDRHSRYRRTDGKMPRASTSSTSCRTNSKRSCAAR